MQCHICGQEMRVIKAEVISQNDTIKNTIETWRCDRCDGLLNRIKRLIARILA
jgi:hypothetical protein